MGRGFEEHVCENMVKMYFSKYSHIANEKIFNLQLMLQPQTLFFHHTIRPLHIVMFPSFNLGQRNYIKKPNKQKTQTPPKTPNPKLTVTQFQ